MEQMWTRRAWDWATRNMLDRMLLTGIAFGALPLLWHSQMGYHSSLSIGFKIGGGLLLGYMFVQFMSRVFGTCSFYIMQKFFPGSMHEMNTRNVLISLAMLWLGSFLFIAAVTTVSHFTRGWYSVGSILALLTGSVVLGACYGLTHHANHLQADGE